MKLETARKKILEYLQNYGPTNTYRLSTILKVDRLKLISLLKQKRIDAAREIHLKIKNLLSNIEESNQRDKIIKDWNRIKELY